MRNIGVMRWLSLAAMILPMSCAEQAPLDCKRFEGPETFKCAEENASRGDKAMLLACFPFSKPEKVVGLWVIGFEKNDFFEGKWPSGPAQLTQRSDTELIAGRSIRSSAPYDALEVEVVGRRSLCEFGGITPNIIVAEKLKVRRRTALYVR